MASSTSGYKTASEKFLTGVLLDQVWWCNINDFWVIPKVTSANLCKPIHDITNSPLPFVLLNVGSMERNGKIIKVWLSGERK